MVKEIAYQYMKALLYRIYNLNALGHQDSNKKVHSISALVINCINLPRDLYL